MQDDDSDDLLNSNGENGSGSGNTAPPVRSTRLTKIEQIELWAKSCPSVPSNDHALKEFEPTGHDHDTPKPDDDRNNMAESKTGDAGRENLKPEVSKNQVSDVQTVMLKVNMLQAMPPVKFDGNPADFPTFRRRLINNLEDGILIDSQKIEFLPKFVSGEAYETVKRVTGCS